MENLVTDVVRGISKLVLLFQKAHGMFKSGVLVHLMSADFLKTKLTHCFHLVTCVVAQWNYFSSGKFYSLVQKALLFGNINILVLIQVLVLVLQMLPQNGCVV